MNRASEFSSKVKQSNTLEENRLQSTLDSITKQFLMNKKMFEKERNEITKELKHSKVPNKTNKKCVKRKRKTRESSPERFTESFALPTIDVMNNNKKTETSKEYFNEQKKSLILPNIHRPFLDHRPFLEELQEVSRPVQTKKQIRSNHLFLPPIETVCFKSCFHKFHKR